MAPTRLEDGVYDHLLDDALAGLVALAADREVDVADLEAARTPSFLAAHLRPLIERVLSSVKGEPADRQRARVEILNRLLVTLADAARDYCKEPPLGDGETHVPDARHLRLVRTRAPMAGRAPVLLPETPLSESALLVNARGEPCLGHELRRELASADRVDLLCAFVKWSGLRFVLDELREVVDRGRARGAPCPLRVLTTAYIGASDASKRCQPSCKQGSERRGVGRCT